MVVGEGDGRHPPDCRERVTDRAGRLGAEVMIATNATGALDPAIAAGPLVTTIDDIIASKEATGRRKDRESLPRLRSFREYWILRQRQAD